MRGPGRLADPAAVIEAAMERAGEALSRIVERRLDPTAVDVSYHDPLELPELWREERENPACVAFYQVTGDLSGYLLLAFPADDADEIARALAGVDGSPEMLDSVVGEIGNIAGSAFLNYMADRFRLRAAPTPPQVVRDMLGALLQTVAAAAAAEGNEQVPVVKTSFALKGQSGTAYLLWITDAHGLERLVRRR